MEISENIIITIEETELSNKDTIIGTNDTNTTVGTECLLSDETKNDDDVELLAMFDLNNKKKPKKNKKENKKENKRVVYKYKSIYI